MKFGLKQNHEIAGITDCEITKCKDPLYLYFLNTPKLMYVMKTKE